MKREAEAKAAQVAKLELEVEEKDAIIKEAKAAQEKIDGKDARIIDKIKNVIKAGRQEEEVFRREEGVRVADLEKEVVVIIEKLEQEIDEKDAIIDKMKKEAEAQLDKLEQEARANKEKIKEKEAIINELLNL